MMNGQAYDQPPRQLSLLDPFLYSDYSEPFPRYHVSYWEERPVDVPLDTATSCGETIVEYTGPHDMSGWVEYGDDCIHAGPSSFPSDEYYPSAPKLLEAQAMVQTVSASTASEATFSPQHAMMVDSWDVGDSVQLNWTGYLAPLPQQVSDMDDSEVAPHELVDHEMDVDADDEE